jgi:serine/threonine-protein kinase ATR
VLFCRTSSICWVSDARLCNYLGKGDHNNHGTYVLTVSSLNLTKEDIASAWLTSARLARKAKFTHQSFNAVLHASQLGAHSATIEHSRLLWAEGHHRKAIQSLEGAIAADVFRVHNLDPVPESNASAAIPQEQNILSAQVLIPLW